MHPKEISILEYSYELPADRIAAYPLDERDDSRLLIYRDGEIGEERYRNIAAHIAAGTLLVLNDTRVIRARILFTKPTGATIEIFCLEPFGPDSDPVSRQFIAVFEDRNFFRMHCCKVRAAPAFCRQPERD